MTQNDQTFGLSFVGAAAAALAGAMMGAGYGLLQEQDATTKNNQMVMRRAQGGALLVMGLYLWAPSWLRKSWLS